MKKRYQIGDLVKISSRFDLAQWRGHTALVKRIDGGLLTLEILGPGSEVTCTFEDFIGERLGNLRDFYTRPDFSECFYTIEYSQYSNDNGMYPFHVGTLKKALEDNLRDYYHHNRQENKWQIIYTGSYEDCHRELAKLQKIKQREWTS